MFPAISPSCSVCLKHHTKVNERLLNWIKPCTQLHVKNNSMWLTLALSQPLYASLLTLKAFQKPAE